MYAVGKSRKKRPNLTQPVPAKPILKQMPPVPAKPKQADPARQTLTDCNFIDDSSINLVRGVQHLVIDALREKEHPTHLHFAESIRYAQKIGAHHTWFTHISHDSSHRDIIDWIRRNCPPSFSCPQDLSSTNGAGCTQIIYTERTQHTGANANTIASAFDGLVLYC